RNPADVGVVVVELLAYAADQLSYFQDAVANEAYLGTARRRVSMRRHARLLDYTPREGSNARTFVQFQASGGGDVPARTQLVTRTSTGQTVITPADLSTAVAAGAQVFETMHRLVLNPAHNQKLFHTRGDEDCCLPKGATRATLADPGQAIALAPGDLLAFIEVRGAAPDGAPADADLSHRHVVRLTRADPGFDPLFPGAGGSPPLRVI